MANFKEFEIILKALGSKRRLAIIRYIQKRKEATVGEVAEEIRISIKSTSKHLVMLKKADILEREQRGMQAAYFMSPALPELAQGIIKLL